MMAVASLFTFASLTDGRAARDLPKQHPEKKTEICKMLVDVVKTFEFVQMCHDSCGRSLRYLCDLRINQPQFKVGCKASFR